LNLSTKITLADLGALSFALPQVSHLTGHATADVQVTGPLMQPKPSGRVQVRDLAFMLPDTGVGYRDGELNGQIDSLGQLSFSGQLTGMATSPPSASSSTSVTVKPKDSNTSTPAAQASIAKRHLLLSGTGDLAHLPDWQIQAIIKGNAVPVLRIPSLFVDASPNLTIKADQSGATLGGSMLLPTVTARIEKLPDSAVRSTPDLVIVGAKSEPKSPGYPVQGDIALKLGDQVTLAGMGFSTGITGGLDLRLRPDKPITAYGEIDLKNGVYKAYGQNLAIQSGQLIFVGPLTDPGLAVSAARTVDTTVVGLKIGGTLHDPKTTVFSQPSMPESDALSLLLTGRKLNDGSSADASVLLNAIAGLGISQGDDIAREIGQTFGLDTVGLDTTGGIAGTRLTLGKRLGDNLLVRYAVGVTTGVGEVITQYKLNKLFAIEVTASPAATGGDLIYRIH
ncbi:MAG TPA: translocation/assembly module TamB domain-containing protein, partial [Halothiobacillus sp.]|nr:translocation/assembly module TamB domain-containing protein [Halothiobacillus sp.]